MSYSIALPRKRGKERAEHAALVPFDIGAGHRKGLAAGGALDDHPGNAVLNPNKGDLPCIAASLLPC